MTIKQYTYRSRNDFKAIFRCEHCGHEFEQWGYDDANYHINVVPNAICPNCGKNSLGETKEESEARLGRPCYRI